MSHELEWQLTGVVAWSFAGMLALCVLLLAVEQVCEWMGWKPPERILSAGGKLVGVILISFLVLSLLNKACSGPSSTTEYDSNPGYPRT
jgi:hypothetical protein